MKKMFVTVMAICLYQISAGAQAPVATSTPAPAGYDIPQECKNLALMAAELVGTDFSDGSVANRHEPGTLLLKAKNGSAITKLEYLGGDSEDESDSNFGKYPCDLDKTLCTTPAGAGGANDWARVTIGPVAASVAAPASSAVAASVKPAIPYYAEVVVSMGSRGGCIINSVKNLLQ